jgi:hypothetical protein
MEFSSLEEKDRFGNWLSGFVDGEGCFGIYCYKRGKIKSFDSGFLSFEFSIQLREDDRPVLERIKEYLNCGNLVTGSRAKMRKDGHPNARDQVKFCCRKLEELHNHIVPQFDRYPLRSKKQNDFILWKKALLLQVESIKIRGNKQIYLFPECVKLRNDVYAIASEMRSTRNPALQRSQNSFIN